MLKKNIHFIFLLLILVDLTYSFYQHLHIQLDGDMSNIILPSSRYAPLMQDPLGISVLTEGKSYASPNRFFAHWTQATYFRTMPFFLQNFVSPIDSLYLASALMKTAVQIFLLWLLVAYITGKRKILDPDFLLAAMLMAPLFHTTGYYHYMGLIDHSITYTIFYPLALGWLMLFFLPFYRGLFFGKKIQFSIFQKAVILLLAFFISLNGPLIPALVLLICPMILGNYFFQKTSTTHSKSIFYVFKNIDNNLFFFLSAMMIFCMYSFFLGTHTSEGIEYLIPVSERYTRLPYGIFTTLTTEVGFSTFASDDFCKYFVAKKTTANGNAKKHF